jgi:predicted chitinase
LITQAQFQCAAKTKGGNPDISYYNGFTNSLAKADITTKEEAAKYLAHSVWETVGFIYTKEVYCQTNDCSTAYPNQQGGLPGKVYYGRGMLQLTWDYNYKAASQYLYGDDRLIQNPDQVANDPAIGWATAAYFWHANVHTRAQTFGNTLKAINGALECDGGSHAENRQLRFNHYKQVLTCLGMSLPPESDGACSAW